MRLFAGFAHAEIGAVVSVVIFVFALVLLHLVQYVAVGLQQSINSLLIFYLKCL